MGVMMVLDKTMAVLQWFAGGNRIEGDKDSEWVAGAMQEIQQFRSLPEIVLLAGSSRFQQAFSECAYRLAITGHIVLGKHVFKPGADWPLSENERDMIHAVQFRMCEIANRLHIVNVDSYIGNDTYNLIRHAVKLELPITFHETHVKLLNGEQVTAHHFMQSTKQRVQFDMAALGG